MTLALGESIGISRQRGFWLRCFLGRMLILAALVVSLCGTANANVCVYKTVYVRSVRGYVIDQTGAIVPGAKIAIKQIEYVPLEPAMPKVKSRQPGKTVLESTADQQGVFRIKVPSGEYWIDVQANGFAPAHAYVKVGFGVRSLVHSNTLRLVLSVVNMCKEVLANENKSPREQT